MQLTIPDELVEASGLSETELLQELILALFQQEKISLPKASKLLNMSQIQFQRLLAKREICVHYDVAEFHEDMEHLKATEDYTKERHQWLEKQSLTDVWEKMERVSEQ